MSTSTDPVRQRMAAANPARPEAEPPGDVMSAAVLLDMIDERSGAMAHKSDSQEQGTSTATRSVRRNWAAAFAVAVAVVLVVGIAFGLLNRGGDSFDVAASATTSAATASVTGDGQTVSVAVSGVSGHAGDDLAGVLYEGGVSADLDGDAVGGFWLVVEGDDFTATEVVREPGAVGVGRFPFVSDEALTVEPGMYTLVLWVDDALGSVNRWVPINTDGMGLFGCQVVFEVGDDAQTDVAVAANLEPDGWNAACTNP